jgi:hypothetical protein
MRFLSTLSITLGLCAGFTFFITALRADDSTAPVKIIFDTDMSCDTDDVAALAILNKLADLG